MRTVIVTGGSRGLGLGIARRLAGAGYRVIAVARRETEELRDASREAGALHFWPCDLADTAALPGLVKDLRREFGPVYGLVNNAGLAPAACWRRCRQRRSNSSCGSIPCRR